MCAWDLEVCWGMWDFRQAFAFKREQWVLGPGERERTKEQAELRRVKKYYGTESCCTRGIREQCRSNLGDVYYGIGF